MSRVRREWRDRLFLVALLILVGLSYLLLINVKQQTLALQFARSAKDYQVQRFKMSQFGGDGLTDMSVDGDEWSHNRLRDQADFTKAIITLYRAGERNWEIRANSGWISDSGEELQLEGDVRVDYVAPGEKPVHMTTESLHVLPKRRLIDTDAFVRIVRVDGVLEGVGVHADLRRKRFEILQSKAKYHAKHQE